MGSAEQGHLIPQSLDARLCSACCKLLPLTAFGFDRKRPTGRPNQCKACLAAYMRRYRHADPEGERNRARRYRAAHPAEIKERAHQYQQTHREQERERYKRRRAADPDKLREYSRRSRHKHIDAARLKGQQHYRANPDQYRQKVNRRRAAKQNAGGEFTLSDARKLLATQKRCYICKRRFTKKYKPTFDHVTSLAKGGSNDRSNIALACGPCNSRKGTARLFLI